MYFQSVITQFKVKSRLQYLKICKAFVYLLPKRNKNKHRNLKKNKKNHILMEIKHIFM